jgi:nicotinamide mononucleotide transporter
VLFTAAGIYANVFLQVVYIVMSVLGWYWWLKGGTGRTELAISKTKLDYYGYFIVFTLISTYLLNRYLFSIHDSAPFWDALTTVLSLVALFMQTRKLLESWYVWITVDLIYIVLFYSQHLYLTSILYVIFLLMCFEGLRGWYKTFKNSQKRSGTAVVIGKFYPLHTGHSYLIDTAVSKVQTVTVIVCNRKGETIPGTLRAQWIKKIHPQVDVKIIEDVYDPDDSAVWAQKTIEWLGYIPEFVFTSEQYGDAYAKFMENTHILVDGKRQKYPVSGTKIRSNPKKYFSFLSPAVQQYYENNLRSGS